MVLEFRTIAFYLSVSDGTTLNYLLLFIACCGVTVLQNTKRGTKLTVWKHIWKLIQATKSYNEQ